MTETRKKPDMRPRILVIEDEPVMLNLTCELLSRMGYDVMGVPGGFEAVRLFSANPFAFDMVITDQMMPGMKGTQTARKLSSLRPGIPIVLFTGARNVDAAEAKRSGIGWIVNKPVHLGQLCALLQIILRGG